MKMKRIISFATIMAMVISSFGITGKVAKDEKIVAKAAYATVAEDLTVFDNYDQDTIVANMGAGWNLGNQLEANLGGTPSETAWGNPTITQETLHMVKEAGFTTVRIPVSYLSKIGASPDYTIDSSWLARVKQVVDYAMNEGLYVIINMHGDGYHSVTGGWLFCDGADQETIKAKYAKCWQQIATTFKDYDEHLIFESMNEEFDGTWGNPNTTYYANINAYNQIFVDTVRQTGSNNDKRWLLIPGWNTDIDKTVGNYGFALPTDKYLSSTIETGQKRIMISVHYYSPWEFCGEEKGTVTQWGDSATNSSKVANWGNKSYMKGQLEKCKNKFVANGYPVVIGEYGAIDKTSYDSNNQACREEYYQTFCQYSLENGCVPVAWDNGHNGKHGFGLFNRSSHTVTQQEILDAIMSVYGGEEVIINIAKTQLSNTVQSAETLAEKDYTPESWQAFSEALEAAKALQESATATAEQLRTAKTNLETARKNLKASTAEVDTAKASLKTVIDSVASLKESDYTADSWKTFSEALAAAKTLQESSTATVEQLQSAKTNLETAKNNLQTATVTNTEADKAKESLKTLMDSIASLKESDYTKDSWSSLQTVLTEAKSVYDNAASTAEQIKAAETKLSTAKAALIKAASGNDTGTGSGDDTGSSDSDDADSTGSSVKLSKITLKSVKSPAKKTIKVTWKKDSKVDGYQIKVAKNKKMTKNTKTVKISGAKYTSINLKKFASKTTYYVQIRGYAGAGSKTVYSPWSGVKKVKVK